MTILENLFGNRSEPQRRSSKTLPTGKNIVHPWKKSGWKSDAEIANLPSVIGGILTTGPVKSSQFGQGMFGQGKIGQNIKRIRSNLFGQGFDGTAIGSKRSRAIPTKSKASRLSIPITDHEALRQDGHIISLDAREKVRGLHPERTIGDGSLLSVAVRNFRGRLGR